MSNKAKQPTKSQLINQLIRIANELDWSYFWKDAARHKRALNALEEVKRFIT